MLIPREISRLHFGVAEGEGDVPVRKPHRRRSKTPEDATAAAETKKELKRAKHIMKQLETKMKIMEEEHHRKATQLAASNPGGHIVLEKQVRHLIFIANALHCLNPKLAVKRF